jgi:hypothetical protein
MLIPLLIACTGSADTQAAELHVAPSGSDSGPGTPGTPYATLHAARDAARKIEPGQTRRIVVQAGKHFLSEPLVLTAQDSGSTIEAAKGAEVVLYGGRRITGWEKDGEKLWAAKVHEAAEKTWDFRMLVVNGRFASRARFPKSGHLTHLTSFDVPWMSTTGGGWKRKPTEAELTMMKCRPGDLPASLDLRNAELTVYHMWDESVVGLKANDAATHTLTFSNPAGHPPGAFGVRKYVVWNTREGMTEPGQWFLDRSAGKAIYWPLPGEDMTKAEVLAPTMESLIRVQGTEKAPVRDVTIRGLTLSVTNTPLRAGGFGAGHFDGAVHVVHAVNCRLEGLTIANVGGQGIKGWKTKGLRIERCHVHHTGACGIKADGEDSVVADCRIHDVGVTYPSAIGLWANGQRAQAVHNEVHDTPYTAIASGGEDHLFEGNLIYRAMQELHDGAGIYITFCKRVTVRGNFIRDIADTGGYGASAYYLDEQAEDCLVEGNLSLRVKRPSHNHMAKRNTLRNNVFVVDGDASITFPRSADYRLEKNVIVAKGKITFSNPEGIAAFPDNVLFSGVGKVEGQKLKDYRAAGTEPLGPGEGSILADPKLTVSEKGKITFAPGSPALTLGISPIDLSAAGPR